MENERFEQLWAGLKEQVREARTARRYDQSAVQGGYPSRLVTINKGDADGPSIYVSQRGYVIADVTRDELLKIAAHCICAVEEIDADMLPHEILDREAKQAVSALVSDAHAGMMGLTTRERFPADDEQMGAA